LGWPSPTRGVRDVSGCSCAVGPSASLPEAPSRFTATSCRSGNVSSACIAIVATITPATLKPIKPRYAANRRLVRFGPLALSLSARNLRSPMRVPILTYHAVNIAGNDYADNDHVAFAADLRLIDDLRL